MQKWSKIIILKNISIFLDRKISAKIIDKKN